MNNLTNDKLSVMIPSWTRRLESLKSPISETVMNDLEKFETLIRKEIKDRTRRMQENRIESFIEDLNLREFYDEKKFNDNIKGIKHEKSTPQFLESLDGTITSDLLEARDKVFPMYWQSVMTSKIKEAPLTFPNLEITVKHHVSTVFDVEELRRALQHLSKFRAPGPDQIPSEFIQALNEEDQNIYLQIYRTIWEKEWVPRQFKESIMTFIPKSEIDTRPDLWRPISLLNSSYKWFTTYISRLLRDHFEKNNLISEFQFGFMKNRSIPQVQMIMEAIAKDSRNKNKEFNVLSIDCEKAFDSGEHGVLSTLEFY